MGRLINLTFHVWLTLTDEARPKLRSHFHRPRLELRQLGLGGLTWLADGSCDVGLDFDRILPYCTAQHLEK